MKARSGSISILKLCGDSVLTEIEIPYNIIFGTKNNALSIKKA